MLDVTRRTVKRDGILEILRRWTANAGVAGTDRKRLENKKTKYRTIASYCQSVRWPTSFTDRTFLDKNNIYTARNGRPITNNRHVVRVLWCLQQTRPRYKQNGPKDDHVATRSVIKQLLLFVRIFTRHSYYRTYHLFSMNYCIFILYRIVEMFELQCCGCFDKRVRRLCHNL